MVTHEMQQNNKIIKNNKDIKNNKNIKNIKSFIIFMLIILYIIINPPIILSIIKIFQKSKHKSINYNKLNNNTIINSTKGRIFYCTTYNNEAEILYTLIWRLYDYVDKFIIVISNRTYSGKPKNFTLKSFEEKNKTI